MRSVSLVVLVRLLRAGVGLCGDGRNNAVTAVMATDAVVVVEYGSSSGVCQHHYRRCAVTFVPAKPDPRLKKPGCAFYFVNATYPKKTLLASMYYIMRRCLSSFFPFKKAKEAALLNTNAL